MIEVRPFARLGHFQNYWLDAHHHFSFGSYYDPQRMGLGSLRVWNDDSIRPGTGFDRHGHRDMEIVTYVRRGAITHRDHLGNEGRTLAGDVQVMSAGSGIEHEEHNREAEETQIFQIWIQPAVTGIAPRWETRSFPQGANGKGLVALASGRAGDAGALEIHQDAAILAANLQPGESVTHLLAEGRGAYLVAATGAFTVNGQAVAARDGVAATGKEALEIRASEATELLVADVAL
ncbi:MAG: pirin family protein [Rhodospirillales bacterium]